MKKLYITPSIKTRELEMESLMAALSGHDEYSEDPQLGKQNFFSAGDDESAAGKKGSSVWGWHEDDDE